VGRIVASGAFPVSVLDLAVTTNGIWLISDETDVIVRFASP
jgi:hypothetical protein